MNMRPLQADMHDPDPLANRCDDRRVPERLVQLASAQATDSWNDPQHHMQRLRRLDLRPLPMQRTCTRSLRFASGAPALAAVAKQLLLRRLLPTSARARLGHAGSIATFDFIGKLKPPF